MNGRKWLVQLVVDQLMQYLPTLAARLVVGKVKRWANLVILAVGAFWHLICYGGLVACLVTGNPLAIGYLCLGVLFTCSTVYCWREIKRETPLMESELAAWLESHGRRAISAF